VEHSGYLSTSLDFIRVTGMNSSSRILQAASYSFDASIFENLSTLLCGGCVCTPDEETREEKGLARVIRDFGVDWAYLTPSLVKTIRPDDVLPGLETLILMGEAPAKADINTWAGRLRLMNAYGPSECCVASAVRVLLSPGISTDPSIAQRTEATNFGCPVGGLFWVVEPANYNQLVPIGAVVELA
jgi:non-ribosomal peptide synthetase component F